MFVPKNSLFASNWNAGFSFYASRKIISPGDQVEASKLSQAYASNLCPITSRLNLLIVMKYCHKWCLIRTLCRLVSIVVS
jgi:hypothetical protein